MRAARYIIRKGINLLIVLFAVLFLTALLFGATGLSDKILKAIVDEQVRAYRQALIQEPGITEEMITQRVKEFEAQLIRSVGLDKPWYIRLPDMIIRIIFLDLGTSKSLTSFSGSNKVADIILERLPFTVMLVTTAEIVILILGLGVGTWLSTKVGRIWDRLISLGAAISYSLPSWWLAIILIFVFSYYLNLFPSRGILSPNPPEDPLSRYADMAWHTVLPVATLVGALLGSAIYVFRSILVSTASEDFVAVARAKGVPEHLVRRRYIIRPSLHPILTQVVLGLAGSLTGAILTETVFYWPGMGRLYYDAILANDESLILGLTYLFTLIYIVARFILELLYIAVDPRVGVE